MGDTMTLMEALTHRPGAKIIITTKSGMQYKGMCPGGIYKRNLLKGESWHWACSLKIAELLTPLTDDEQILGSPEL